MNELKNNTMKKLILISSLLIFGCQTNTKTEYNRLTQKEKSEGWQLLFDGKTSKGWRGTNMDNFPSEYWEIKNGVLTVLPGETTKSIITTDKFSDFEFVLEFRLTPNANSGVKYYVLEDEYDEGNAKGLEYQIIDDSKFNGDLTKKTKKLASLYDIFPSKETNPKPIGEWNQLRIVSSNNNVEHWLNGEKVLSYIRGSEQFREKISNSKFKKYENFGEAEEGHIMLQHHHNEVSFRNIKIREL